MSIRRVALAAALLTGSLPSLAAAQVKYIDVHAHLIGQAGRDLTDYPGAARAALSSMDEFGAARMILMPPPMLRGMPLYDADELLDATSRYRDRFAVAAGGGSLNPLLHEALRTDDTSEATKQAFIQMAERLAAKPIVAFGEMTTEHFSLGPGHPYLRAPADHPLLLALADVAARHDLPIELHMEAVDTAASLNSKYRSPPNPQQLVPNIQSLERLLAHNRNARIIWSHAGWDNTGQRTPELHRRLFAANPNLYVSTKMAGDSLPVNRIAERGVGIDAGWLAVIKEFPDRFLVATDQFHLSPSSNQRFPRHPQVARAIIDGLPPELARKIGMENPLKVYPRLGK